MSFEDDEQGQLIGTPDSLPSLSVLSVLPGQQDTVFDGLSIDSINLAEDLISRDMVALPDLHRARW